MLTIIATVDVVACLALHTRMARTALIEWAALVIFFFGAMATKKLLP